MGGPELLPTAKHLEGSFSDVVQGFGSCISELRTAALLRLDDSGVELFEQEMRALLVNVRAIEDKLAEVKKAVVREKQAVSRVEQVIEDCTVQSQRLNFIRHNLPKGLPQQPLAVSGATEARTGEVKAGSESLPSHAQGLTEQEHDSNVGEKRKKRPTNAPRRYVTEQEFGALSSYMTQRLPISKINTAVDEAADLADGNMKLLSQARGAGKLATQEWKRAQSLLINVAGKDVVKGRCWFTDADLRRGSILKPDKTSKAILTILRHLGRIHEARLPIDGKLESIYVLNPESQG